MIWVFVRSGPTPAFSGAAGDLHTGTGAGTPPHPKTAPSPGAAPAASAAKQCWAATLTLDGFLLRRTDKKTRQRKEFRPHFLVHFSNRSTKN